MGTAALCASVRVIRIQRAVGAVKTRQLSCFEWILVSQDPRRMPEHPAGVLLCQRSPVGRRCVSARRQSPVFCGGKAPLTGRPQAALPSNSGERSEGEAAGLSLGRFQGPGELRGSRRKPTQSFRGKGDERWLSGRRGEYGAAPAPSFRSFAGGSARDGLVRKGPAVRVFPPAVPSRRAGISPGGAPGRISSAAHRKYRK